MDLTEIAERLPVRPDQAENVARILGPAVRGDQRSSGNTPRGRHAMTDDGERDLDWWRIKAAELSAELGLEILWCPLGFEVPRRDGGITHVSSPDAVRTILGGNW